MTLKELGLYCFDQGIKNSDMMQKYHDDIEMKSYYQGKTIALFWIAACIQNNRLGGTTDDDNN